jgi:hypothetical protein
MRAELIKLRHSIRKRGMMWRHAALARCSCAHGLNRQSRPQELIISLTTIPERLAYVHLVIDSLLRQTVKPDRLVLWLKDLREPGRPVVSPGTVPASLTRLMRRGLTIQWCRDIGCYCKLIPALRAYPQALIATADDDVFYHPTWLQQLYEAHLRQPEYVHCHRAHRITFDADGRVRPYTRWDELAPGFQGPSMHLLATGVGGVLYHARLLHPDITCEARFLQLCPKSDDLWYKAMQVLNGVQCRKVAPYSPPLYALRIPNNRRLLDHNVIGGGNDVQLRNIAAHYPRFAEFLNGREVCVS